jgi:hypothetical protein
MRLSFSFSLLTYAAIKENGGRVPVVVEVILELEKREGLLIAIQGRDESTLLPLLQFLAKNIANPEYTATLTRVCQLVLGMLVFSSSLHFLVVCKQKNLLQRSFLSFFLCRYLLVHYWKESESGCCNKKYSKSNYKRVNFCKEIGASTGNIGIYS